MYLRSRLIHSPLPHVQRHEIERLSVWQNPRSQPELTVPNEEGVYSWSNPTQSDRHWRSTVAMAFNTSPHLAFQLVNRYNNFNFAES